MLGQINKILGLESEEHDEWIVVNTRCLRSIFIKLEEIFKKTTYSKVFKLELKASILTIEASTTLQYRAILAKDIKVDDITGVFIYKDIANMLCLDITSRLIITSNMLKIENGDFEVVFSSSPAEVDANIIKTGTELSWPKILSENIAILKNMNAYGAIFKKVNKYEIEKGWIKVCYPSVYIGQFIKELDIEVVIDNNSMLVWLLFVNQSVDCTIVQGEGYLTYFSDFEQLTIYVTKPNYDTNMEVLFNESLRVGKYSMSKINKNIPMMAKNFPNAQLQFFLFTNGIKIVVEDSGSSYKISDGKCDNLESTFKINLKVCNILSKFFGEYVTFYRRGERVCLHGNLLLVLSVIN